MPKVLKGRVGELLAEPGLALGDRGAHPLAVGRGARREDATLGRWPRFWISRWNDAGPNALGADPDIFMLAGPSVEMVGADPQALLDLRNRVGEALQRGRKPGHVAHAGIESW